MSGLGAALAEQFRALSMAELAAVVAAVAYLIFAIRQSVACWLFACISTAIYVVLFTQARLYMEAVLNVFYFAMAVYGWHHWVTGRTSRGKLPVVRWPVAWHAAALAAIGALAGTSGWALSRYTDAEFPYLDSLTTWGAFWATWLVARKVLENWWYWLVIDAVSIVIYWDRGLELTALLFVLYVAMIPFGLVAWSRALARSPA